jgi:hypothetical protein
MIVSTHDRKENQDRRLRLKTQDARLANIVTFSLVATILALKIRHK